jgi:hypothetical protein
MELCKPALSIRRRNRLGIMQEGSSQEVAIKKIKEQIIDIQLGVKESVPDITC